MVVLSLSGSGPNIFDQLGAVEAVLERNPLDTITHISATSAGSIVGTCLCLGKTPMEISDALRTFLEHHPLRGYYKAEQMIQNMGVVDSISFFQDLCSTLSIPLCTLGDLHDRCGIHLSICTTNVCMSKAEFLDYETAPNLVLWRAIAMSCAIPMLFTPLVYREGVYVDGAVMNKYPADRFGGDDKLIVVDVTLNFPNCTHLVYDLPSYLWAFGKTATVSYDTHIRRSTCVPGAQTITVPSSNGFDTRFYTDNAIVLKQSHEMFRHGRTIGDNSFTEEKTDT